MTPEELSEEVRAIQEDRRSIPADITERYEDYPEPEPEELDEPEDTARYRNGRRDLVQHPKPKYTYAMLAGRSAPDLRKLAKEFDVNAPVTMRKDDVIIAILKAQAESMNYRFGG